MRKLITSVAAAAFLSIPAHAATVLLDSVTSVSDGYEFSYAGTLDDTEGLRNGSQLVIFDFAGIARLAAKGLSNTARTG